MTLKEKLENLGYRFLLKYDEGIQYEFQLQKENIHSGNYLKKVLLLGKLIFEMKVFKHSSYDKWIEKQKKLFYPEWESDKSYTHVIEKVFSDKASRNLIAIEVWGIVAWPILGEVNLQNDFINGLLSDVPAFDSKLEIQKERERISEFLIINEDIKSEIIKACENNKKIILIDQNNYGEKLLRKELMQYGFPASVVFMSEKKFKEWLKDSDRNEIYKDRIIYVSSKSNVSDLGIKKRVLFENPCELGKYYRAYPNYNPVINAYNTVVNIKFHLKARQEKLNYFYGMGYKYGGILVSGICQWLNSVAREKRIQKIVFLSRDCDIISRVYKKWFNDVDSEYIYVSRRALSEAFFKEFPEEYVRNLFLPKMAYDERSVSVEAVFQDLEIDFLLENLEQMGISKKQRLDFSIYQQIIELIQNNYEMLVEHFSERREAALRYFSEKLTKQEKLCVLDLGWKGTTIHYLRYFQKMSGYEFPLQGALVAAMEDTQVANKISRGEIVTYLFANERVQNFKKKKGIPYNNFQVKCIESLFTSPENTLTNYYLSGEKVELRFRDKNANADNIAQIQKGVMDFQQDFLSFIKEYDLNISMEDAFAPLGTFLDNRTLVEAFIHNLN